MTDQTKNAAERSELRDRLTNSVAWQMRGVALGKMIGAADFLTMIDLIDDLGRAERKIADIDARWTQSHEAGLYHQDRADALAQAPLPVAEVAKGSAMVMWLANAPPVGTKLYAGPSVRRLSERWSDKEIESAYEQMQERRKSEAAARLTAHIGTPCTVCSDGKLEADGNGYHDFLRCNACSYVPMGAAATPLTAKRRAAAPSAVGGSAGKEMGQ